MKVLEVNNSDIIGRRFNGFDLHLELEKRGISAKQVVIEKKSDESTVIKLIVDEVIREEIRHIESKMSISNLLYPYAEQLLQLSEFKEADIVHFHFPYHQMFSLLDYPAIMDKRCVWTVHDPWITTGNCTHPLDCVKWKKECKNCVRLKDDFFPMLEDNTNFMWHVKKDILKKINPTIIVASQWMKNYITQSPITEHFNNIYCIPFGINIEECNNMFKKNTSKKKLTIGFRSENNYIKGSQILYQALRNLKNKENYNLVSVGNGMVPMDISQIFHVTDYGWVTDKNILEIIYKKIDIFIIPSLAESFCLMAIEAMAAGCMVICFTGTVVEEIINAPEIGISVKYGSSKALSEAVDFLYDNATYREECREKGIRYIREKYTEEKYVQSHINLFNWIQENNSTF